MYVVYLMIDGTILNTRDKVQTVHSLRTVSRPLPCLYERRWTYVHHRVSSRHRGTRTSRTPVTRRHAAVVCRSCHIDVDCETAATVMTSQWVDVTSATACWRWLCQSLTQSSATWRTTCRQLTLARYSGPSRRRTVDDHDGRRRCQVDISFRRR